MSVLAFAKAHDLGVAGRIGVVDEDETIVLIERAIRDSQQATLAALLADAVGQVGEDVDLTLGDCDHQPVALCHDGPLVIGTKGEGGGGDDLCREGLKRERLSARTGDGAECHGGNGEG